MFCPMTDRLMRRIALALLFPVLPAGLAAQDTDGPVPVLSLRETAATLARSGAARGDARTVLAAAQLMITAERTGPGLVQSGVTPAAGLRPEEAAKAGEYTGAGLLRLATKLAVEQQDGPVARQAAELAGNEAVGLGDGALAAELRRSAGALATSRGAEGGPIWSDGYLAGGAVSEFKVGFEGGYVPNTLHAAPSNPDGDLDCYLYDGATLVGRDAGYGSECRVKWSQRIKGEVTLRIRNTGGGTYFVLSSN